MSMRTRGTSTRAPPPSPASPRHTTPRHDAPRVVGMSRADVYWTLNSDGAPLRPLPVRFVSLRCFTSRRSLFASFSCAYIREVAPLQRDTTEAPLPLATKFRPLRCCCVLPHPVLRRAPQVGTVGLRESCTGKGDKVFGERSARLLAASSRTIRSPTTSFLTSTTSSTT